jgi:hypothetical protein
VNTNQPHLYPTPERMHLDHAKLETLSKLEESKKFADNDDLSKVSKVSVKTPKTEMSRQDNMSSVSKTTT